jgi:hypothetical protein
MGRHPGAQATVHSDYLCEPHFYTPHGPFDHDALYVSYDFFRTVVISRYSQYKEDMPGHPNIPHFGRTSCRLRARQPQGPFAFEGKQPPVGQNFMHKIVSSEGASTRLATG